MGFAPPAPPRNMPGVDAASRRRAQELLNRRAENNPDDVREPRALVGRGWWLVLLIGVLGVAGFCLLVLWIFGLL